MVKDVFEFSLVVDGPEIKLADRIADAVSAIARAVSIAGIRGTRHPYAHKFRGHRSGLQVQRGIAACSVCHGPCRKSSPCSFVLFIHGVAVSDPVLHLVGLSVGVCPSDLDRVDAFLLVECDHYPLRMERIVLSRKVFGEIWVAFPVGLEISVVETREAVKFRSAIASKASVTQRVAIGMADHFFGGSG